MTLSTAAPLRVMPLQMSNTTVPVALIVTVPVLELPTVMPLIL